MSWYSLFLVFLALLQSTDAYRVVCYYTNWAQYRPGKGQYYPEDVDPHLCTHLMYAFAKPVGTDLQPYEWNDDSTQWSQGMYERTMQLRQFNPNLKIILAVGGYNMASQPFEPIVDNAGSRAAFAQNAIAFLRQRNFDGIDMDWEYPGSRGSPPQDKQKFVLLIQEMERAFKAEAASTGSSRLLITGALPAGKDTIDAGYDIPALSASMDFISVMTYDFHGSWEPYTGINSPLYAHANEVGNARYLNLDWVAQYYVSLGAPKDKLNIGLGTYGRSFTLDTTSQTGVGAPAANPGDAGQFTREKGFLAYYEICDMVHAGAQTHDVPSQRGRYLVQGNQWVGYDDVQTITEKSCYIKSHGFGGIMFWALDLDDFSGQTCGEGTYPLIKAAKNEMSSPGTAMCIQPSGVTQAPVYTQAPAYTTQAPLYTAAPATSATPSMSQTNTFDCFNKINDFYPDPLSCEYFYICANQVSYRVHCALGLLFNANLKHCDFASVSNCQQSATAQPVQATTATPAPVLPGQTTLSYLPSIDPNAVCQSIQTGLVANPSDCHSFYSCQSGVPQLLHCQGAQVFNPSVGGCDFTTCSIPSALMNTQAPALPQVTVSTTVRTNPPIQTTALPVNPTVSNINTICTGIQNGILAHPTNCHKFYQCAMGVAYEMTCQGSQVFNSMLNACDFSPCP